MAKINSMVGRLSGTVAYKDGSVGVFHGQYEDGTTWSIDTSESYENLANVCWDYVYGSGYVYWGALNSLLLNLPFISYYVDEIEPASVKPIKDMVAKIEFIFTMDDGTIYPSAIEVRGTARAVTVTTPYLIASATNLAEYQSIIRTVLQNSFDYVYDV